MTSRGGKREGSGRIKGKRDDIDEMERAHKFQVSCPRWIFEKIRDKKNRSAYIVDLIRKDLDDG